MQIPLCYILFAAPGIYFFILIIGISLYLPVHYRAWVENSDHKFEDTWQEQRPIELVLGKGNLHQLLLIWHLYISIVPGLFLSDKLGHLLTPCPSSLVLELDYNLVHLQ